MVVRGLLWDIWSEWWGILIEELRRHDLAYTKTNTKTKMKTLTRTFRINPQRAIIETCDLWNIWSEWWGHLQRQWQTQRQMQDSDKDTMWLVNMREIIDSREPELITMNGMGWGDWWWWIAHAIYGIYAYKPKYFSTCASLPPARQVKSILNW